VSPRNSYFERHLHLWRRTPLPNCCMSLHPAGFPTPPHQAARQSAGPVFVATSLLHMTLGIVFRNYLSPVRHVPFNKTFVW
jgi:hypothetical protein